MASHRTAWTNGDPVYWRKEASLNLNESIHAKYECFQNCTFEIPFMINVMNNSIVTSYQIINDKLISGNVPVPLGKINQDLKCMIVSH